MIYIEELRNYINWKKKTKRLFRMLLHSKQTQVIINQENLATSAHFWICEI